MGELLRLPPYLYTPDTKSNLRIEHRRSLLFVPTSETCQHQT
jgi:hypothetical protein